MGWLSLPDFAKRRRETGCRVLGTVEHAAVHASEPSPLLDLQAEAARRTSKPCPGPLPWIHRSEGPSLFA